MTRYVALLLISIFVFACDKDDDHAECKDKASACSVDRAPECIDESTMRIYSMETVCDNGSCSFAYEDKQCTNCPDCDLCAEITCEQNDNICLMTTGNCTAGVCAYEKNDSATCDDGDLCTESDSCAAGECGGQAKVCNGPPADECLDDAVTLRSYAQVGSCNPADGACEYSSEDMRCAEGCVAGACKNLNNPISYFKASNSEEDDLFSISLALDGDVMAIGAAHESGCGLGINPADQSDNACAMSGAVYLFSFNGTEWRLDAYLKAGNTGTGDRFGTSVALDGGTLVVGAPLEDSCASGVNPASGETNNDCANAGAVYVFIRDGGVWREQAYLKMSNPDEQDHAGQHVAIDGDTIAVGAEQEQSCGRTINGANDDNSCANSGAAYVFTRTDETWTQQAFIKPSNTDADDRFGYRVAVSEDTLAVGALWEDGCDAESPMDNGCQNAGAAYIFKRNAETWTQQAYLKGSNTERNDIFARTISLEGDIFVAGSAESSCANGVNPDGQDDNACRNAGAAYVFVRNAGFWTQSDYLKASNSDAEDRFGRSVAIAEDRIIVSAGGESSCAKGISTAMAQNDNDCANAGAVYIFERMNDAWVQKHYIKASNTEAGDGYGSRIAFSGHRLLVGSINEGSCADGINADGQSDNGCLNAGAAYLYDLR